MSFQQNDMRIEANFGESFQVSGDGQPGADGIKQNDMSVKVDFGEVFQFGVDQPLDPEAIKKVVEEYLKENPTTPAAIGVVELLADKWEGDENLYSQVATIDGVTENSQVDLTPSVEQLTVFYEKDLTFVTENDGGIVTVYAIGQKPTNDYTIQVTITEVERTDQKIVGVTVGTPLSPQTIREKLNPITSVNGMEPDENGNVELDILKMTQEEMDTLWELLSPYTLECAPVLTLAVSTETTNGVKYPRVDITTNRISESLIQKLEVANVLYNYNPPYDDIINPFVTVTGTYDDARGEYTATYKSNYSYTGRFACFLVRLTYTHPVEGTKILERTT